MSSDPQWLTTKQVADALQYSEQLIRTRCRDRSRSDAIPANLLDKSGKGYRIHPAFLHRDLPATSNVTPLRTGVQTRIDRLVAALTALREENITLATENITLRAQLADRELVAS